MGKKNRNKRVRNRSSASSVSDVETSFNTKKQKTNKEEDSQNKCIDETPEEMAESNQSDIAEQLKQINQKLENVVTKDDKFLKNLIKNVILEMRSEIFSSIEKKLEVMEAQIFDYMKENAQLKSKVVELEKVIETRDDVQTDKLIKIEGAVRSHGEQQNEQAQYSRKNNIRINGIPETRGETAIKTAQKVVTLLNEKISGINLKISDIDIAHRIGKVPSQSEKKVSPMEALSPESNDVIQNIEMDVPENEKSLNEVKGKGMNEMNDKKEDETREKNEGSETMADKLNKEDSQEIVGSRQIIVKFVSRMKRDEILKNRKQFKGSNIFVSEDLTRLNMHVLMVVKKSNPIEVQNAWSKDGKIFYKNSYGEVIHVPFREYHKWLNVSWNNVK